MDLSQGVPIQIHLETFVTQGEDNETHVFDEPGTLVQMGNAYTFVTKKLTKMLGQVCR